MDMVSTDEIALLRRLRTGDARAFETMYHRYKRPLAKSLLRLLKAQSLAEDVLQESFVKVWERRAFIDPERTFGAYLYRIAVNLVYDIYRRSNLDRKLTDYLISHADDVYTHVEEQIINREQLGALKALLEQIPPQRRRVFELFKLEGKSYQEISMELGISKPTINSHITKVNQFLRDKIGGHLFEGILICAISGMFPFE
ncbi:RNA polymerase sigma factor [Parapedobacter deserti]|uniref:RNA polymerase sigma factor n=1 Tax=Parapedobacter deserti TaxID=1912957 RepID=A0ABV7JQ83_9SPHI